MHWIINYSAPFGPDLSLPSLPWGESEKKLIGESILHFIDESFMVAGFYATMLRLNVDFVNFILAI